MSVSLLRPLRLSDLENILEWRNHPSIRLNMLTQHQITIDEHTQWFESTQLDDAKCPMIYEEEGIALGYVNFNICIESSHADWGFYTAPHAPSGTGTKLGLNALEYAFKELNLKEVCGQALRSNTASINFHLKLGFLEDRDLQNQYKHDSKFQDIICYKFLQKDWAISELK